MVDLLRFSGIQLPCSALWGLADGGRLCPHTQQSQRPEAGLSLIVDALQ